MRFSVVSDRHDGHRNWHPAMGTNLPVCPGRHCTGQVTEPSAFGIDWTHPQHNEGGRHKAASPVGGLPVYVREAVRFNDFISGGPR